MASISPTPDGGTTPDVGFQAAVGFYVGATLAGLGAVAGALAGLSSEQLLGTVPTLLTAGLVVGIVLGRRAHGLPERLGSSRRTRLACTLSPLSVAGLALTSLVTPLSADSRLAVLAVVATLVTTIAAVGLGRLARNRYVAAVTPGEPIARWDWRWPESTRYAFTGVAIVMIAVGSWNVFWTDGGGVAGLMIVAYGLIYLVTVHTERGEIEPWNPPEVRVYEPGVVVNRPLSRKLYPWEAIDDVRLTDDELVLERRRWFDLRCDRENLEDAEAVYEAIERARTTA